MSKSIHDLVAFQRSVDTAVVVYKITSTFPRQELYGLTSQLRRASVSVCSDIAEGQGRLTYGEWRQFLSQARGSLFEVEAQCVVANRLAFLVDDDYRRVIRQVRLTGKALAGLIAWVRKAELTAKKPSNRATQQPS
jgi:four helix bundle protein